MDFILFGIPTHVSAWTLIMAGIILLDSYLYIKKMFPDDGIWRYILAGLAITFFTILAVVIHEFSHGLVASLFNVKIVGAGMSWWGAYVQPSEDEFSRAAPAVVAMIALAGPLSNIVLGLLAAIPVYLLRESLFENTVQYFSYINLRLAIWNLLPIFVLDGGRVVNGLSEAIFPADAVVAARWIISTLVFVGLYFANSASQKWLKEL